MSAPVVSLEPMKEYRFRSYLARVVIEYAKEGAKATGVSGDEALERSRSQIARLLPDGRRTPDQHFRVIVADRGKDVGILWFAVRRDKDPARVFIYDIDVSEDQRGKGYGSAALAALEAEARGFGAGEIALHVFLHNEAAIRLYERLGYQPTLRGREGMQMAKSLD